MSLHNSHFWSLKVGAAAVRAFEGKVISPVQESCYILLVGGWRKMAHLLSPTCLHKPCQRWGKKNGEMFHVFCLFLPKAKKKEKERKSGRAKESLDRYSDIPREDVAGMKACHFVRDDHGTAPPPFPPPLFWNRLCQNLKDISFLLCPTTQNRNGTLKWGVYKAVKFVLLI